jgi:mannose-6-phosphate isomerase-like protein (cupin superfamily)
MMIRFNLALFAFSAAATLLPAAEPSFAPATIKTAAELAATVKQNLAKNPDQADAPIVNTDRYRINVVRRGKEGIAMAHATGPAKGTEVHYIIDGSATVVTGGTLIRAAGHSSIEGGEPRHVAKGDVVVIPAGTPHWYKEVEGSVTYLEVRFDVEPKN